MDDLIEEMQSGLDDLKNYLESDDFKGKLEKAKSAINDMNDEGDWSGSITIDGETIDLEKSTQPIQDIMEMLGEEFNLDIELDSNSLKGAQNDAKSAMDSFMDLMRDSFDDMMKYLRDTNSTNSSTKTI